MPRETGDQCEVARISASVRIKLEGSACASLYVQNVRNLRDALQGKCCRVTN